MTHISEEDGRQPFLNQGKKSWEEQISRGGPRKRIVLGRRRRRRRNESSGGV